MMMTAATASTQQLTNRAVAMTKTITTSMTMMAVTANTQQSTNSAVVNDEDDGDDGDDDAIVATR